MEKRDINVDSIMKQVGSLSRFQVLHYSLLAIIALLSSSAAYSYIFTTGHLDYRCKIPICERSIDNSFVYSAEWLRFAVPFREDGKPEPCQRFHYSTIDQGLSCDKFSFNRSVVENCGEFVFASGELTIVNEFNITCQDKEWQLALIGSLGYMAEMLVLPWIAVLSDKYGRRPILITSLLLSGVFGLIKSMSFNYIMFAIMEFFTAFVSCGTFMTAFIMAIESAQSSHRVYSGTLISLMFPISQVVTGLVAMWTLNFRTLLQVLYIPSVLAMGFIWMVPESVRWLVTNGKAEKAKQIILKAANMNKIHLSNDVLQPLTNTSKVSDNPVIPCDTSVVHPETFRNVLRSRILVIRLVVNISIWFMIKLICFGMTIKSFSLAGNKHVNYIIVSGAEIPAMLISILLMNSWGRKIPLCVSLLFTGVACVGTNLIPDSAWLASILVYNIGKFCVTIALSIFYVYSSEMFPTSLRHTTINVCMCVGMLGATLAPFTMLLVSISPNLPLFVFGSAALFCGTVALLLPETLNTKLPDTIAEAEHLVGHRGDNPS